MLAPSWAQFKLGPFLRRETDLRTYHNLFHPLPGNVKWIKKLLISLFKLKVSEREDLPLDRRWDGPPNVAVCFSGLADYFERLNGRHEFLISQLRAITRPEWLKAADRPLPGSIGLHMRLGDFTVAQTPEDFRTRGAIRTPMSWFASSLKRIRDFAGRRVPAFAVSDGRDEELAELLALGDVTLIRTGSAIADLLLLSRAHLLIGSGGSSFSAWAAFIGQMPAITIPGQSLSWFKLRNMRGQYIGEFDPESPDDAILGKLNQRLDSPHLVASD
jgi:hypothetical protein